MCDLSCDRNGLAAYAILLRGLSLCDQPFALSAVASALMGIFEADQAVIKSDVHESQWSEEGGHAPNGRELLYTRVHVLRNGRHIHTSVGR